MADIKAIAEAIVGMTTKEVAEVAKVLKEEYGIDPAVKFSVDYEEAGMSFGGAIQCLKRGQKVARKGWNGKGMWLWLKPGTMVKSEWCHDPALKTIADNNGGEIEALGTVCNPSPTARSRLTFELSRQTGLRRKPKGNISPCIIAAPRLAGTYKRGNRRDAERSQRQEPTGLHRSRQVQPPVL